MSKFNFLSASIGLGNVKHSTTAGQDHKAQDHKVPDHKNKSRDNKSSTVKSISVQEDDETTYQHYRKDPEDIPTVGTHDEHDKARHDHGHSKSQSQKPTPKTQHHQQPPPKSHGHKTRHSQWVLQCYR